MDERELWRELGQQLRVDAVRASAKAGSGHPTSSMSAADLAAVLLAGHLRYDFDAPRDPRNDRLVFSKGHASPLVYGLFRAAGALSEEEFGTYRQLGSRLEGHPVPVLPWVDVATGSLGQGLPIGVGMAIAGKRLNRLPFRVWVICGDSEMAEGSMWEAAEHAAFYELDNLTAIVDVNRLGQRGETMHGWDLSSYSRRLEAFGWHAIEIDGHDVEAIDAAYREAESTTGRPTAIVARDGEGQGVLEGRERERLARQGGRRGGRRGARRRPQPPDRRREARARELAPLRDDGRRRGRRTRSAARSRPARRTARRSRHSAPRTAQVVALDGEVSNSTFAEIFRDAHPERFVEMYIAEQQMVAAAVGMQVLGWKPFSSTFAAFLSRAYDFVRMAADQPRDAPALRLARGRLDRRGRPVADGRSRTSRSSARSTARRCSTRATATRRRPSSARWASSTGSPTSARPAATRRSCTARTRRSRSAARRRSARATTSRSSRPASPCTRRCARRRRSPRRASRPA